ncbi:hypothetical protein E2C01_024965 [Portunus trituberculatus]|uniref:Uncharacterized protein n=1 Tax=Portunus trituberculatus TaxID=210409 RepID=A0A5B7EE92_PORTR|nr:hypothetical protein [Portunus trituberculatus]
MDAADDDTAAGVKGPRKRCWLLPCPKTQSHGKHFTNYTSSSPMASSSLPPPAFPCKRREIKAPKMLIFWSFERFTSPFLSPRITMNLDLFTKR